MCRVQLEQGPFLYQQGTGLVCLLALAGLSRLLRVAGKIIIFCLHPQSENVSSEVKCWSFVFGCELNQVESVQPGLCQGSMRF